MELADKRVSIPLEIYKNLQKFFEYRKVKYDDKWLPDAKFLADLAQNEYVVSHGSRNDKHGERKFTAVIIKPESRYSTNTPFFKKLLNLICKDGDDAACEIVIIADNALTCFIKTQIKNEMRANPNFTIEYYEYNKFLIVVPEHQEVPKYHIAADEEIAEFCKINHETPDRFQKIRMIDPMIIWCGARPGDIIKIYRLSETVGVIPVYRQVIG